MPEVAELVEQHPELRLRPIATQEIHAHNGVTWTEEPGAYEWWEISAIDAKGSGLLCTLHLGNAFDPVYRRHVRQLRAGRFIDASLGRKSATAAISVAVFQNGRRVARSHVAIDPAGVRETPVARGWTLRLGGTLLAADGDGWRLHLDVPRTTSAWRLLLGGPARTAGRITADISLQPRFHTSTFWRGLLPDSPSGAVHEWLPACPSAAVSGNIRWSGAENGSLDLQNAGGSLDHFRGSGPIGEGIRRYFIARTAWPGGAALGELVIIRKYIQLAPTLMIFADGQPPRIIRGDRTPRADFQRSAWLLGYPLLLGWISESQAATVEHHVNRLADASPCRITAISRCSIRVESAAREIRFDEHAGLVQLIQPPRIDAWPWRWWCGPAAGE